MNKIERFVLKLGWKYLEGQVPDLKRWLPLIGGVGLIASFVLDALGYVDVAVGLRGVLKLLGAEDASPVQWTEVAQFGGSVWAAYLLGAGIYRKFRSILTKK